MKNRLVVQIGLALLVLLSLSGGAEAADKRRVGHDHVPARCRFEVKGRRGVARGRALVGGRSRAILGLGAPVGA